jgi:hypothetical protein
MLEYCKMIMHKISFNAYLFRKEYWKSLARLSQQEKNNFRMWVYRTFNPALVSLLYV